MKVDGCLHGWPPNAGTGNPTLRIPVIPHSRAGEQDLPGDQHRGCSEDRGGDDMADQSYASAGVHANERLQVVSAVSSTLAANSVLPLAALDSVPAVQQPLHSRLSARGVIQMG